MPLGISERNSTETLRDNLNRLISTLSSINHTKSKNQLSTSNEKTEDNGSKTNPKYSVQEKTIKKAQNHIRPRVPGQKISDES